MIRRKAACVFQRVVMIVTRQVSAEEKNSEENEPARRNAQNKKKPEKKQTEPLFHEQNEPNPADMMKASLPVHFYKVPERRENNMSFYHLEYDGKAFRVPTKGVIQPT